MSGTSSEKTEKDMGNSLVVKKGNVPKNEKNLERGGEVSIFVKLGRKWVE